jgi:hypothetical protein
LLQVEVLEGGGKFLLAAAAAAVLAEWRHHQWEFLEELHTL